MLASEQLSRLLLTYPSGISYKSLGNEVDPLEVFPELTQKIVYTIQPVASLLPANEFEQAHKMAGAMTFLLIPGRRFDASGTRHGNGGGWYDRFLSIAPTQWIRAGFCYSEQFSLEPLLRQAWDEPVDFVCVVNKNSKKVICYKTSSRVY